MADGSVKQGRQAEDTDFVDGVATLSEVLESMDYSEEGDEFDSRGDYAFSVLSDRYEELRGRHEAALSTVADLRERVSDLEEELGQKEEAALEVRAEQVATEAVEQDKKFAPAKKEWLQERLMEDFEGTKEMIDNVPSGAAGPSESLETADTSAADTDQEKVDKLKSQGIRPVYPDEEGKAETYRDLGWEDGEDFFLVSEIDKYDA
jgi:chromosome segregation ATPase